MLSRRYFFFGSLSLPVFAGKKAAPPKPNLVLFLVDGLPSWMLGCYGNQQVKTPNIDRLCQTGTHFLNHFVCTPEAAVSRATFLTGKTPMQLGEAGAIPAGASLEKLLTGLDYASQTDDVANAPAFIDNQSAAKPFFLTATYAKLTAPYDGVPQKYHDLYSSEPFAEYAPDSVSPAAKAGKEMLADIRGNVRKFAAALSMLDDQVAAVLAKLYQKQLLDNTLVVFTSTTGALLGRHGFWDAGDGSDPVNMYDESIATPMMWSWPGKVPAVAKQVELISSYDFVPTIAEATGATLADPSLCGKSYLLLATGKPLPKKTRWRAAVCGHYKNTDMARVERYKAVLRDGGKGPNELYDLVADPREKTNQADNEQFLTIKNSLSAEISGWKQKYSR